MWTVCDSLRVEFFTIRTRIMRSCRVAMDGLAMRTFVLGTGAMTGVAGCTLLLQRAYLDVGIRDTKLLPAIAQQFPQFGNAQVRLFMYPDQ